MTGAVVESSFSGESRSVVSHLTHLIWFTSLIRARMWSTATVALLCIWLPGVLMRFISFSASSMDARDSSNCLRIFMATMIRRYHFMIYHSCYRIVINSSALFVLVAELPTLMANSRSAIAKPSPAPTRQFSIKRLPTFSPRNSQSPPLPA